MREISQEKSQGSINITMNRGDNHVKITMTDNGCGMDSVTNKGLFGSFYTNKGDNEGTRFGTLIAFDMIKQHQGPIDVESKVGQGAPFTLTRPLH